MDEDTHRRPLTEKERADLDRTLAKFTRDLKRSLIEAGLLAADGVTWLYPMDEEKEDDHDKE